MNPHWGRQRLPALLMGECLVSVGQGKEMAPIFCLLGSAATSGSPLHILFSEASVKKQLMCWGGWGVWARPPLAL